MFRKTYLAVLPRLRAARLRLVRELVGHGGANAAAVASRNKVRAYTEARVAAFALWSPSTGKANADDEANVDDVDGDEEAVQEELDRLMDAM